ncbi:MULTISPECIES: hypothetical protein [Helicobacter]|uniref:Uncharacterized protein n=1 Tax=Helicobacter ibis TaxID=2962633 RepID=A0ABT4VCQ6_9HELI|nr:MULTISPECIES: hypothetical protein [Helicobacter]MDA3966745.1 hypothetical protein [Helicobacter sp. WB40]MDA3968473.1 hypothetical protein [Helicobacter ibis]
MIIFNSKKALKLIPKKLLTQFSVIDSINVESSINCTISLLENNKRIQALILVFPRFKHKNLLPKLEKINNFKCDIYFIQRKARYNKELEKLGILILL